MKPIHFLILGVIGILVGLGFVFPAIAHWRDSGAIAGASVGLLMLGLTLTIAGLFSGVKGLTRPHD